MPKKPTSSSAQAPPDKGAAAQQGEFEVTFPVSEPQELLSVSSGAIGDIPTRLKELDNVVKSINVVVILSLISIIVAVVGLILDQMRFNAAFYKEYSDKNETIIQYQKTNQELLKTNQQLNESLIEAQKANSSQP